MESLVDAGALFAWLSWEATESCGDVLAPIPGERWVCVGAAGHGPGEHIADDGTRW